MSDEKINYMIPNFKFSIREDLEDTGDLFLPTRANPKATGWDVKAALKNRTPLIIKTGQHVKIPLGFRTFAPEGWWYELKPRSSTFGKKNLHSLYGTIDEDYEGELIFACQYIPELYLSNYVGLCSSEEQIEINFGDAIGQIIPVKRQEMFVEKVTNEEYKLLCSERNASRGSGGFGSTDQKECK